MTVPENRGIVDWLGGLEPAWTLLDRKSLDALMEEPSGDNPPLRLATDLTEDELALSAVARNASILLLEATGHDGLKLILRPLYWFGLVEYLGEDEGTDAGADMTHAWRKSTLFDRFLSFEVVLKDAGEAWH